MKKRKGMSMLLVLTIVLLLSSCAADAGAESQVESVGSSADPMDENKPLKLFSSISGHF